MRGAVVHVRVNTGGQGDDRDAEGHAAALGAGHAVRQAILPGPAGGPGKDTGRSCDPRRSHIQEDNIGAGGRRAQSSATSAAGGPARADLLVLLAVGADGIGWSEDQEEMGVAQLLESAVHSQDHAEARTGTAAPSTDRSEAERPSP